jgi:hypothetical protein
MNDMPPLLSERALSFEYEGIYVGGYLEYGSQMMVLL